MQLPEEALVGDSVLPHVIVADDAFQLRPYIMKPFPGQGLTRERRIYNYRLSRARNVVENGFGILAARWRIFQSPIIADLELTRKVVHSCVILHNYLLYKKDLNNLTLDNDVNGVILPGSWRNVVENDQGMISLNAQGSNNYTREAAEIRNKFAEYFNGVGAVEWQDRVA